MIGDESHYRTVEVRCSLCSGTGRLAGRYIERRDGTCYYDEPCCPDCRGEGVRMARRPVLLRTL